MTDFNRKIAVLILPLRDNDGNQLKQTHQALRDNLLAVWGGYTQTLVTGAWKDDARADPWPKGRKLPTKRKAHD